VLHNIAHLKKEASLRTTLTAANRKRFLDAYARCGILGEAARLAKVGRRSHYVWMEDPNYQRQFESAREEACDLLEAEARRRAVDGVEEPVIYQGELCYAKKWNRKTQKFEPTKKPLTIRKYSDFLLMFLLKALKPEIYRDNWKGEIKIEGTMAISSRLDYTQLTDEEFQQLKALVDKCVRNEVCPEELAVSKPFPGFPYNDNRSQAFPLNGSSDRM
jgi:hypothetical protein